MLPRWSRSACVTVVEVAAAVAGDAKTIAVDDARRIAEAERLAFAGDRRDFEVFRRQWTNGDCCLWMAKKHETQPI